MFFIPLSQVESVELVIHALRAAGGQVDCTSCPAYRVCMKQCLAIADAVDLMIQNDTLPGFDPEPPDGKSSPKPSPEKPSRPGLKVIK